MSDKQNNSSTAAAHC